MSNRRFETESPKHRKLKKQIVKHLKRPIKSSSSLLSKKKQIQMKLLKRKIKMSSLITRNRCKKVKKDRLKNRNKIH